MTTASIDMDYSGPEAADYANVHALNLHFLRMLQTHPRGLSHVIPADGPIQLATLNQARATHLATAPFLLFSLRERDTDYWGALLDPGPTADMFNAAANEPITDRLIAATTGFLWELAKRNPYAARLICGASLHWCEQIAELTLCHLLERVEGREDLLVLRCGREERFWRKLLCDGTSTTKQVRSAAHLGALQRILTNPDTAATTSWRMAASRSNSPALHIADPRE